MDEEKIMEQPTLEEEMDAAIMEENTGCGGCEGCGGCGEKEEGVRIDSDAPVTVADIHFRSGGKVYFFDPGELTLKPDDHVIIETARGPEYGIVSAGNHVVKAREVIQPLRKVLRLATEQDEKTVEANSKKEKEAYSVCLQKIEEHKLDMQLVSAECAFDGSKILFFFTADGRVDFRELVKNLASIFHTRIELRQIGVRDKAKMVGGLGICGRPFCCKEFLDDFQPVSIKMAKTQNLSLNPTKISGTCGRLMCCLKYEQEAYEDLIKTAPKPESFVDTPDGRGTVTDVNLLRQSVRVRMEKAPDTFGNYKNDEIYVIRNGKAKKTDEPIPDDFAPISSNPQRRRRFEELDEMPEVVMLGEKKPEAQPVREGGENAQSRNRRRRKPSGGQQGGEKKPEPKPQNSQPKAPKTGEEAPKPKANNHHRRRRPRHRKPGEGGAQNKQQ